MMRKNAPTSKPNSPRCDRPAKPAFLLRPRCWRCAPDWARSTAASGRSRTKSATASSGRTWARRSSRSRAVYSDQRPARRAQTRDQSAFGIEVDRGKILSALLTASALFRAGRWRGEQLIDAELASSRRRSGAVSCSGKPWLRSRGRRASWKPTQRYGRNSRRSHNPSPRRLAKRRRGAPSPTNGRA